MALIEGMHINSNEFDTDMDGEIYYTTNDIGTDGAPYSFTTCRGEYGIISVKDYLAGSQDWVQVTLQGRDLV